MIAKSTRIALEVVAGILAVVVLLVLVALWRLASGPVQFDMLTPHIEEALADPQRGLAVRVGGTELTWGGWRRTIDFHARDVRIRNADGFTVAALPDVVVRLSLRALVQGVIAPTAVEVIGARLSLVRGTDGSFEFHRWPGTQEERPVRADFSQVLPSVIDQLMSKPVVDQPLTFLTTFRIFDGQVTVTDRMLQRLWRAPQADIELRRDAAGLAGEVALSLELDGSEANLSGGFLYDRGTDRIDLSGDFAGLRSEALISAVPRLAPLSGLALSLEGSISASLGVDGAVDSLRFEVAGSDGEARLPRLLEETLPVREAALLGRVSGPDRRIDLETLTLRLGTAERPGPAISGTATLLASEAGFGGDLAIEAEATATDVAMRDLRRYWPLGVGGGGRPWVLRNIPHGTVEEAVVRTALRIPGGGTSRVELDRLDGTLRYRDLEIHYLRPMPPVSAVSGTAAFDPHGLTFTVRGGRRGELSVRSGSVEIFDLDRAKEAIRIALDVAGPLRASLELLDHERLKLVRRLGIDPADTRGQVGVEAQIRFPIHVSPTFDDMQVSASAELDGVAVRRFLFGQDATEGRLALTVDKTGMEIRGPLKLAEVPMDVVWREAFTAEAPLRTRFTARIERIGEAGRRAFGLDAAPYLEGPVSTDLSYTGDETGRGTLHAALGLDDARLAVAPLKWTKPAGVPGAAELTLDLVDHRLAAISRADIDAGTLRARGTGRFDDAGKAIASLALEDLAFDNTRLNDVAVEWRDEGIAVRIGGGVLYAKPFLEDEEADVAGKESRQGAPARDAAGSAGGEAGGGAADAGRRRDKDEPEGPSAAARGPAQLTFTPFELSAPRLDAVYLAPDRFLERVGLELRRSRRGWERIGVEAVVPGTLRSRGRAAERRGRNDQRLAPQPHDEARQEPAPAAGAEAPSPPPQPLERRFAVDFARRQDGAYTLSVRTDDMGAALRALDRLDTMHGGTGVLVGQSQGPLPNYPLKARIEVRDYVMAEAPVLTRLLTLASLTGISDLLSGEGIRFTRLVGDFTLTNGVLETDLIRAYGPALGLTAKGRIDFDKSTTDLRGTVVPAYSVNRILGEIPLLGALLTGGKGEGLLAVTYTMTGKLGDPTISVNPLSALTPGFLRGLFSGAGGREAAEAPRALPERADP